MSKSGQPSAKADTGGQRVPKSKSDAAPAETDKKAQKLSAPAKASSGKRPTP